MPMLLGSGHLSSATGHGSRKNVIKNLEELRGSTRFEMRHWHKTWRGTSLAADERTRVKARFEPTARCEAAQHGTTCDSSRRTRPSGGCRSDLAKTVRGAWRTIPAPGVKVRPNGFAKGVANAATSKTWAGLKEVGAIRLCSRPSTICGSTPDRKRSARQRGCDHARTTTQNVGLCGTPKPPTWSTAACESPDSSCGAVADELPLNELTGLSDTRKLVSMRRKTRTTSTMDAVRSRREAKSRTEFLEILSGRFGREGWGS